MGSGFRRLCERGRVRLKLADLRSRCLSLRARGSNSSRIDLSAKREISISLHVMLRKDGAGVRICFTTWCEKYLSLDLGI